MNWRAYIPWSMVAGRAALGPAIALVAFRVDHPEIWFGLMIVAGLLSDIYDGILARRWGTATNALRVADSAVDTVFYIGVLVAVVHIAWPAIFARIGLLAAVLALELTRWIFDSIKFHRMASYHSYASKAWSILLTAATIALLCFHGAYWLLTLALLWGVFCDLEGLAMSILLPVWTRDVKDLRRAWILRKQLKAAPTPAVPSL